jgi:hypothetical protein
VPTDLIPFSARSPLLAVVQVAVEMTIVVGQMAPEITEVPEVAEVAGQILLIVEVQETPLL